MSAATVLAFGAHPDDVELTIGGTVALLVRSGHRVVIVDLTRGELGTRGTPKIRAEEAAEAARILGVETRENLELPDGGLGPERTQLSALVRVIRQHRPQLVLAPLEEDLHPDHKWAGRLIKEAAYLSGLRNWDPGLPPHRPRAILQYMSHTRVAASLVIDVTETFETKRRACLAYRSQFHDPDSQEPATYISSEPFWAWWEARARHDGHAIGATFGEAFVHQGPLPVRDPVEQFRSFGYYP